MDKKEIVDQALSRINVDYVEEAIRKPARKPNKSVFVTHPKRILMFAAAAMVLALFAGGVYVGIRLGSAGQGTVDHDSQTQDVPESQSPKYHVSLYTEMNSKASTSVVTSDEAYQSSILVQREGAEPKMTISFDGETYTGTYSHSDRYAGTKTFQDFYSVDEIVLCNQFAVSSVDHELTYISFGGPPPDGLLDIEKDLPRISSTEIERIAQEWAQKWFPSEEYSFYLSSYTSPRWGYSGRYHYCCCRKVGGIETTDRVNIHVSDRGTLTAISTGEVGWTKRHQKELDAFSAEDAIEAAKEASGLSSPTVKEAEFGITPDDRVFLRVYLVGANDEAPVVLAVTQE